MGREQVRFFVLAAALIGVGLALYLVDAGETLVLAAMGSALLLAWIVEFAAHRRAGGGRRGR